MTRKLPPLRLLLGILALAALPARLDAAAPGDGPRPLSFDLPVLSDEAIDHRFMGFVDAEYLKFEDGVAAVEKPGRVPFRVAEPVALGLTIDGAGSREVLADGGSLWRLRVTSPGAVFLAFTLSGFALPPGAELRFYSVERDYEDGPYTAANNNAERWFVSPAIPGDSAVIEVYTPAVVPFDPAFTVASVSHGYRDFRSFASVPRRNAQVAFEPLIAKLGACERDVNCPEGSQYQADKRAVAQTFDGRFICTGTLLNNARGDCRPFFLTAAHCVSRSQTAAGMVFYWNYENTTCGGSNANRNSSTTGSSLRATNSSSDFTLLELSARPPAAFNAYFAGFNRSASAPASAVSIHHPDGAAKKISFENDAVQDGGSFSGGWGGTHWRIVGWDSGTTEGGSSGCGLLNPSHQVVGQLHGGTADCTGGWDEYGKLSVSWGLGASTWLDPDGTGVVSVNGKESSTCSGTGGGTCTPAGNACTSNSQCCSGACKKKTKLCA